MAIRPSPTSPFEPAGGNLFIPVSKLILHVALHHNTCAECDEQFDETDALRNHIHENH